MLKVNAVKDMNSVERLKYMNLLLKSQLSSEEDSLANLSNASAIIKSCIEDLNWVGFYLLRSNELVLGPFQGKPACTRIKLGKGVCGSAAERKESILVPDVNKFPGHIFCDNDSKSELVVPIIVNGEVKGVLDLDSPILNRFTDKEKEYFEEFVNILKDSIDWGKI